MCLTISMADIFSAGMALADVHLASRWREEEVKYRKLEILRRQIDEKVEQLRSIANLAALIAGFDIVVLIELSIPDNAPQVLVAFFAGLTLITVISMCISFITCTLMLVGVLKAFDLQRAKMPFRKFWLLKCEDDWMRAFWFFSVGVPLFMANICIACWVKFFNHTPAAIAATVICVIGILGWYHVHHKWGHYLAQVDHQDGAGEPFENINKRLDAAPKGAVQNDAQGQRVGLEQQQPSVATGINIG